MRKRKFLLISLVVFISSGGICSIFTFSNDVTRNISMGIAEDFLWNYFINSPEVNVSLLESSPCDIYNCWDFVFVCESFTGDFYNVVSFQIIVKNYKVIDYQSLTMTF